MRQIKLNNGIMMPMFGLGTFKVEPGSSAYETILSALKVGYRLIDTAQMYHNEESIGQAIKDSDVAREDIFITSKIMHHHQGDKKLIRQDIEKSLTDLQTDYIDLMLIHWPNHDYAINKAVWEVFEEYYQNKKFRAIGLSNFNIHHIEDLLSYAKVKPALVQVELHPGLNQIPLQKYLDKHDIALQSYGPLMKGKAFDFPYADTLKDVANNHKASIAQVIIAWGLARKILMIPKSVHEFRLKENLRAVDIVLSKEEVETINKLNRGQRVYTDPDNNPFHG